MLKIVSTHSDGEDLPWMRQCMNGLIREGQRDFKEIHCIHYLAKSTPTNISNTRVTPTQIRLIFTE